MDTRKQAIIDALRAFIRQRPGLEFGNYGNVAAYNAEKRSIVKDLHQAERLVGDIEARDSITANDIIAASKSAFSGRLQINGDHEFGIGDIVIDYCTGQYWPTEYRKAVAAVAAYALWDHAREHLVPSPKPESVGDWLRSYFRRTYGKSVQERWFN